MQRNAMHKGTVVLIPFPFTDLSGSKVRPAVVLAAPQKGDDMIVVFISSAPLKHTSPYAIPVSPSESNGLKIRSHIKIDKLATLQKGIAIGELGVIETDIQKKIDANLRKLFSL